MIALADCNNFFASCERSIRPELEGKPIVVLSNNDGCIIARSNEAKVLGYKMGEPFFKVKDKLLQDQVYIFSSNVVLYRYISNKIMCILDSECNAMEVYSIDEAFMDFSKVANPDEKAISLRNQILKELNIPISIGIAKTKVLAKLASNIAKKHTQTGVFFLSGKELVERALSYYSVEALWGIGRKQQIFLNNNGIFQASQLAKSSKTWIKRYLNIRGLRLVKELNEISCFHLQNTKPFKKSIMISRSFKQELGSFRILNEALSNFASSCGLKLRKQKTRAKKMALFIQTNRFKRNLKSHYGYLEFNFPVPTNDSIEIIKTAYILLDKIYDKDCLYKRAGIIMLDIITDKEIQLNLFVKDNPTKRTKLMKVYDDINCKMGEGTLRLSIQGINDKWGEANEPISFSN